MLRFLSRVTEIEDEAELKALLWSSAYAFCIFSGYYIIRPMRDEMALAGGVSNLPWLFAATLVTILVINPPFAALVARLPRQRFVSIICRFFALNLLIFFLALWKASPELNIWIGRVFYVWTSVFNLFVISIFWAFMADTFSPGQGRRLFGVITFGGTFGGICGSAVTASLAERIEPITLFLFAIALIELAVMSMRNLTVVTDASRKRAQSIEPSNGPLKYGDAAESIIGGSSLAGISNVLKSRYLSGIAIYVLCYTITATFLYFQQAEIVERYFIDRAARTAVFAKIDLLVNVITIFAQVFLTARLIRLLGLGFTLALLPALCVLGFSALGLSATLAILVVFQVLRRASDYGIAKPSKEILYTVIPREDKYKAKAFLDTFVYRVGDQVGAWGYALMLSCGLGITGVAFLSVPLSIAWLLMGLWLGKKQSILAWKSKERAGQGE